MFEQLSATPWYGDPFWAFVGVVAQVVSLAAIVIALVEVLRLRRRIQAVVWDFTLVGTATANGKTFHLGELYNAGSGTAYVLSVTFMGARPVPDHKRRFRQVMASGERAQVMLSASTIADSWIVVTWSAHEDSGLLRFEWFPVAAVGRASSEWDLSHERLRSDYSPRPRFWLRWKSKVRRIGPGHYPRAQFRTNASPQSDKLQKVLDIDESVLGKQLAYTWGGSSLTPTADLPFHAS